MINELDDFAVFDDDSEIFCWFCGVLNYYADFLISDDDILHWICLNPSKRYTRRRKWYLRWYRFFKRKNATLKFDIFFQRFSSKTGTSSHPKPEYNQIIVLKTVQLFRNTKHHAKLFSSLNRTHHPNRS